MTADNDPPAGPADEPTTALNFESFGYRLGRAIRWVVDLNWNAILFTAGVVGAAAFAGYGYLHFRQYQIDHAHERKCAAEYYAHQSPGKTNIECIQDAASKSPKSTGDAQSTEKREQAPYYDLKAQQDMAEWTYALLIIGVLGFGATVVGIVFVYANLVATRHIGENQSRAFVHAASATLTINRLPDTGMWATIIRQLLRPRVTVEFVNTGETPAFQISGLAELSVSESSDKLALTSKDEQRADAVTRGTPASLEFILADGQLEAPPEPATAMTGPPSALGTFEPVISGPPILRTVSCRGKVFYSDVFGQKLETEFHFRYFGTIRPGDYPMDPVRGNLAMFKRSRKRQL